MYKNIFDLDNTAYRVWNVVRTIQRRVSKTQGLLFWFLLPMALVISINEVYASSSGQMTGPGHKTIIQSPEIPQPPQPPFDISSIIDKAEHIVRKDPFRPGIYRAEDPAYRVEFTPEAISYFQKRNGLNNSGREDNLQFRLISIDASDIHIPFRGESALISEENRVIYSRTPDIKEVYDVRKDGVEQSWVIERPLSDKAGDLIINGEMSTELSYLANDRGGIDFLDENGAYVTSYGKVVIIDNAGKRITLSPQLEDERLTITVPAEWLKDAAYPVIVDPVLGADIRVDTLGTADNYPAIAFDGTNYLIVWQTGTPNATGTGTTAIVGVRVSNSGTILDATPLSIGNNTTRDDEFPSVAYDSVNSRYIVVWMMWNDTTAPVTTAHIYRNTVTTSGGVGTSTAILTGTNRILAFPAVACCDLNDRYYVVYGRNSTTGATSFNAFWGQTYNRNTHAAAGASNPTATVSSGTITPNAEPRSAPRLYSLSTTKYMLTWETFGADTNGDISANLLTATATPSYSWGTQVSVANTGALAERYARADYDGANAFIVYQSGLTTAADVYGRFVTPGATSLTLGATITISNVAGSGQTYPAVAYTSGTCSATQINRYMVVWQDYRNNATNPDIYASPMNTAGTVETAVAISTNTTYIKERPVIAADSGNCGYMAAWSDQRNGTGNADIYANRIGYPNISNLSPSSGIVGAAISVNGLNFGSDPGAGSRSTTANNVRINGIQVADADITAWSNSSISFVIPAGSTPGTYPVTVTAGSWVSNPSNLTVQANTLQITTGSLPNGYQWLSYGSNVSATGGATPYSWSIVSGSLPSGVTLDSGTGLISGTPGNFGTFNFTVRVTDSSTPTPQTDDQPLSILIYELTAITVTPANPTIVQGQNVQFTATGTFADMTTSDLTSTVTWGTTNPGVATVNSTGLATGTGLGAVTISATK